ncbi:MAG: hypothetical protein V2A65_11065 [Candidatus Omnitrophota bacterium]
MEWETFGQNLFVAGDRREARSLKLPDVLDNFRRYRVTTTWDLAQPKFTKTPAYARLAKDGSGKIGAVVMGRGGGYIKIGQFPKCQFFLFVPLNSLSKKARFSLLKGRNLDLFTEGEFLFAREP